MVVCIPLSAKDDIANEEALKPYTSQLHFEAEEDRNLKGIANAKNEVVKAYNK